MAVQVSVYGLDCQKCSEDEKIYRGCYKTGTQPYMLTINGEQEILPRCPIRLIQPICFQYIHWYHYFKQGFLTFPGTIGNQPAKLLAIFDIIDNEVKELRKRQEKNARTKI